MLVLKRQKKKFQGSAAETLLGYQTAVDHIDPVLHLSRDRRWQSAVHCPGDDHRSKELWTRKKVLEWIVHDGTGRICTLQFQRHTAICTPVLSSKRQSRSNISACKLGRG
jgi:hypothetical protein